MFSHLWETRESLRETRESFLFTLVGSIVNNIDRIITKKVTQSKQFSVQSVKVTSYYLNVTDPLIIPLIFIFLSCREKAHDNEVFSHENLKPHRKSRITTC